MKTSDVQKIYQEFILPTYAQVPVCLVKGKGTRVWDLEGKAYLDFFPGWAVSGLGHCHPIVVNAIREQAGKMLHVSNNFLNLKQAELACAISVASFPARVFFCNSGAEANEGAIKFARKYGSETGRYEMITMKRSFHGRTLAAMTATGQEKFHQGFHPLVEKFSYADFNDLESVKKLVTPKTIAVMLEPIQGEGGIHVASREFLEGIRKLCDEKDMLMILDEVQTGMGRTGKMFAYQHYNLEPDLMTLAKSLGGGVPIGALVVNRRIKKEVFAPGMHASTFGGNPLVCAAGLAVLKAIKKEKLLTNAIRMGELLEKEFEKLQAKYPHVIESHRGMALMRALKLKEPSMPYANEAREQGLLINATQGDVLRIMPPLTVTAKELRLGMKILDRVFAKIGKEKTVSGGCSCSNH